MKAKQLLLIIATIGTMVCHANTMDEANNAYKNKQYTQAIALYNDILEQGLVAPALYYNLGNAYYRTHDYGLAILCYEKALKLSPRDRDIQENLALANSKIQDNITTIPKFAVVRWTESLLNSLTPKGWQIVILCLSALLGCGIATFLLSHSIGRRKGMLLGCGVAVVLLAIAIVGKTTATKNTTAHNDAIVLRTAVSVKGAPDSHSVDMFILHEGTKVSLTDNEDHWYKIRIADGNQGWIEADHLGII